MADRVVPGPVDSNSIIREAVCISTKKIMDSCRDKDCIEDLPVYPTASSIPYIESAISVRPRSAKLLFADVSVDEIFLNRGYYTVDVRYFYEIIGETFPLGQRIRGLAVFDKRVMLFGSEGRVKSFASDDCCPENSSSYMPVASVDAVDPIALHMTLADQGTTAAAEIQEIPEFISNHFGEAIETGQLGKQLLVTLGQFSIIRLERSTQLLIPAYDYCLPEKECQGTSEDDPCTMFSRISFPVDEFFPPDSVEAPCDYNSMT